MNRLQEFLRAVASNDLAALEETADPAEVLLIKKGGQWYVIGEP